MATTTATSSQAPNKRRRYSATSNDGSGFAPSSPEEPMSTRYRDASIRNLASLIVLKTFVPLAAVAWITTQSWTAVALAIALMPFWCLMQSIIGLLSYRILSCSGAPPIPVTPRHGVVVVHPEPKKQQKDDAAMTADGRKDVPKNNDEEQDDGWCNIPYRWATYQKDEAACLQQAAEQRPLRLLVLGDSSAIGVGQCDWPTPIMPESVAKTLSKKMGGRAVYWTCHGTTGASIGWAIRELERGVQYLNPSGNKSSKGISSNSIRSSGSSETDEFMTDDSSSDSGSNASSTESSSAAAQQRVIETNGMVGGSGENEECADLMEWRKRLDRHRERFEPDLSGFYDIVVVMTGLNDAKSALLPFLLTGEDSELRRQAKARGSCFYVDLHLLLETLSRKMKSRVQRLRQTAESIIEKVEDGMERIIPGFQHQNRQHERLGGIQSETSDSTDHHMTDDASPQQQQQNPLVVFPGIPTRILPVFQNIPSTWYGGPPISLYAARALDILDGHKHDVANAFANDLLFFDSPNLEQTGRYMVQHTGPHAQLRQEENVVLSIRDMDLEESRKQEEMFRSYYEVVGRNSYHGSPFFKLRKWLGMPIPTWYKGVAVDCVHPNEIGYDFFGRYVGMLVYDAWQKREQQAASADQQRQPDEQQEQQASEKEKKDD